MSLRAYKMAYGICTNETYEHEEEDGRATTTGYGGYVGSAGQPPVQNEPFHEPSNTQENHAARQIIIPFTLLSLPSLGLRLRRTPSLENLIQMKLSQDNTNLEACVAHYDVVRHQRTGEKLKASNFPATFLKIGLFEVHATHEADLVAKCYFAKKKLVWEILDGCLKKKIEIHWPDILAMRVTPMESGRSVLEIELNKPPAFYSECDPQPRKHTSWKQAEDFTGNQASVFRRHLVEFPPGVLEKHYEKILQCDSRLLELNQMHYPSLQSPYFDNPVAYGNQFSNTPFAWDANWAQGNQAFNLALRGVPTPLFQNQQVQHSGAQNLAPLVFDDSMTPTPEAVFPMDEFISKQYFQDPYQALRQGMHHIQNLQIRGFQQQQQQMVIHNYNVPLNYSETQLLPQPAYREAMHIQPPAYGEARITPLPTYGEAELVQLTLPPTYGEAELVQPVMNDGYDGNVHHLFSDDQEQHMLANQQALNHPVFPHSPHSAMESSPANETHIMSDTVSHSLLDPPLIDKLFYAKKLTHTQQGFYGMPLDAQDDNED